MTTSNVAGAVPPFEPTEEGIHAFRVALDIQRRVYAAQLHALRSAPPLAVGGCAVADLEGVIADLVELAGRYGRAS